MKFLYEKEKIFHSIRWRMVASYVGLTLVTVAAIGVFALSLIQRYIAEQEQEYLRANAQAIARQSMQFSRPIWVQPALQQLAQTAAFLGNAQVRILDADGVVLANSGTEAWNDMVWYVPREPGRISSPDQPMFLIAQAGSDAEFVAKTPLHFMWQAEHAVAAAESEAPGHDTLPNDISEGDAAQYDVVMVQRSPTIWGNRLSFAPEVATEQEQVVHAQPGAETILHTDEQVEIIAESGPIGMWERARHSATVTLPRVVSIQLHTLQLSPTITYTHTVPVTGMAASRLAALPAAPLAAGTVVSNVSRLSPTMTTFAGMAAIDPVEVSNAASRDALTVSAPIYQGSDVVGYVELRRIPEFGAESLAAIRRGVFIAAAGASLLAICIGLGMSRGLTAPLQSLAATAARMSSGDLSARAPVRGQGELSAVAEQFNHMAARLQESFAALAAERDALRRFIADASHELRTPITALRTFNELLQGPAAHDLAAQREFLSESEEQLDRLQWITHNLLDLSRWDAGLAVLDMRCCDAGQLVTKAMIPFLSLADERRITIELAPSPEPIYVTCDAAHMERALCNLLDNALKFTPAPGRVRAGVEYRTGEVRIWVEDDGAGIAGAELGRIFERFYRGGGAATTGSGLGLAIVQSIVQSHGGRVEVASAVGKGSCFAIVLPSHV